MGDYRQSDEYSDAERIAIEYAETFACNHHSLDAAFFARLHRYFDDAEILDLTVSIARSLAFGRMTKVLEVDVACAVPAGHGED
jgi:alkylhydroperoxidase family enzyme